MSVYVTDTHPLIWFTLGKYSLLSKKALAVFEAADKGEAFIYIPAVTLWETALLERGDKIILNGGFLKWTETIFKNPCFNIIHLEPEIIALASGYAFNNDLFDAMIAACAAHLDLPLITKDAAITYSGFFEICW